MTCQTCAHWSPRKNPAMAKLGFAPCDLRKPWTTYPPQHTCSKHKPAPEDVQDARVVWLNKSSNKAGSAGGLEYRNECL